MREYPEPPQQLCSEADKEYFDLIRALEATGKKMCAGLSRIDENSERVPDYLLTYASILEKLGRYESAEEAHLESVRITCAHHHLDSCCFARFALGEFYTRRKMYDEAYEAVQHPDRKKYSNLEILLYIEFLAHLGRKDRRSAERTMSDIEAFLEKGRGNSLKQKMKRALEKL